MNNTSNQFSLEQWFYGNQSPLVSISLVNRSPEGMIRGHQERSMGFVIEQFDRTLKLVVSCRHAFDLLLTGDFQLVLGQHNSRGLRTLNLASELIPHSQPENDLAFFLATDPSGTRKKLFELPPSDPTITTDHTLINFKNSSDVFSGRLAIETFRQSGVRDKSTYVYGKKSEPKTHFVSPNNIEEQEALETRGWIRHRLLQMISRPGFSGSPIIDESGLLYGMNMRGSTPTDPRYAEHGDELICLPVSEILRAKAALADEIRSAVEAFSSHPKLH